MTNFLRLKHNQRILIFLFTPLLLSCIWVSTIVSNYSIFPTNTYGGYHGWYKPGNAIEVKNHYSLDINFIYFPWKFYLSSHRAEDLKCTTSAPVLTPGHQGVKLPDDRCFPMATLRLYTVIDPRRWLERILPFFVGYDLGYLLLVILIWCGVSIALWRMKFKFIPIVLGSAVILQTFWLSKELQYDQYSAPVPFLYLSFASLVGAQKKRLKNINYLAFGIFLLMALLLT
ncbi:MAG: hypothetical protein N5P05_000693 [Chroococcopsis gigantea SAG 12.99]|jgi:hypothetical protein|nr:hypothetical protein [Chlorogloea purpurea SAG 13.99]MDV2999087.1 hypothetical protein [Chroococcopsis gigantea SAG 12.99]